MEDRGADKGGRYLKKRDKTLVGVMFIVGLLVIGVWDAGIVGYLSVSEVTSDPQYIGTDVQVLGIVKEGSVHIDIDGISFELTDHEATIQVEHAGDRPVDLIDGGEVVVIGELVSDEKIVARQVIVGCPSKYVGGDVIGQTY